MKQNFLFLGLLGLAPSLLLGQPAFRRGNPTPANIRYEFYVVDSDDDSPLKPTYKFLDTTYGTWTRVTGFSNPDDGWAQLSNTVDSVNMPYYTHFVWVLQPPVPIPGGFMSPGCSISTNGTICLQGIDSSPANVPFPSSAASLDLVAPLWADWELLTSGSNRTNIYARPVSPDSFYVSFYNLGLKGTSGQVRATFQVLFCRADTSITFFYKSFDGSINGVAAAPLLQQVATIGVTAGSYGLGVTYLHKGNYFAASATGHAQNLHNGLAIKFLTQNKEAFQISNVTFPPFDRYELTTNSISPSCRINNSSDTAIRVFVNTTMTNVTTNVTFYTRSDSIDVGNQTAATYTAPVYLGIGTGSYKVKFNISYRNNLSDQWADNNTFTRYFVYLGTAQVPFREEFNGGLSPSLWSNAGSELRDANSIMYTAAAPTTSGAKAVVLNRLDALNQPYPVGGIVSGANAGVGGDTLTSAPINLSGQGSTVYVSFHYQRGLVTDSSKAGIFSRLHSGPEMPIAGALGGMAQRGDTLIVEGLRSAGSQWNPAETDWIVLGAIPGGFDTRLQTFRVLLASQFLHNHFRLRFRVKASNAVSPQLYFEDADNFAIDAIHVEPFQAHKTELEPIDFDLGNGNYTHVPRDISGGLIPKVRILNNGDAVTLGQAKLHVRILDGLGRAVYDNNILFTIPQALADDLFTMPAWDIHGTQGGIFTSIVTLEVNVYDTYHANDTNVFYRTLRIDSLYALDDETADSLIGVTGGRSNFYYDFSPLGNDSLRGVSFYYTGASVSSSWSIDITGDGTTVSRSVSVLPAGAGWYQASFAPVAMKNTSTYRFHFTMNSGANFGGDASNGLVYYTLVDSSNSANDTYGTLHPDVLGLFRYSATRVFTQPLEADASVGGFLLPMFRLMFSGAATFLPVELVSLSVHRTSSGAAMLDWKTSGEEKLASFEIERAGSSLPIGVVPASNIQTGAAYSFVDAEAPHEAVLYEIFSRDLDGSRESLGHVLAAPLGAVGNGLTIAAFPNPAGESMTVVSNVNLSSIILADPLGRTVRSVAGTGNAAPSSDGSRVTIDVTNLPAGSYYLTGYSSASIQGGFGENESARIRVAIIH